MKTAYFCSFRVLAIVTWLMLSTLLVLCLLGCESRNFTATRPDGTVIQYHRVSIMGDSSSEGVSVAKQGDDLTVDVGPTNSQARLEALEILNKLVK